MGSDRRLRVGIATPVDSRLRGNDVREGGNNDEEARDEDEEAASEDEEGGLVSASNSRKRESGSPLWRGCKINRSNGRFRNTGSSGTVSPKAWGTTPRFRWRQDILESEFRRTRETNSMEPVEVGRLR